MRISRSLLAAGAAIVPLAIVLPVAMAQPPTPAPPPPPPTTPTYICDNVLANQPAVFGHNNCEPFGGVPMSGLIPNSTKYVVIPRKGDSMGNIQKWSCYGGSADMPVSIAPRGCTQIGTKVPESVAPSAVPYGGPGGVSRPPAPPPPPPKK